MLLKISEIILDEKAQPRAELNSVTIQEYADAMNEGVKFPPVIVFGKNGKKWLADGWHRIRAAQVAKLDKILADVREGTLRDAMLYAAGANSQHGMRRSTQDKRRAVMTLLADAEWRKRSNVWIAQQCKVGDHLVAEIRNQPRESEVVIVNSPRLGLDGKIRNLPEKPDPFKMADKMEQDGIGLSQEEWDSRPDEYLGDCYKTCYGPRVMIKGSVSEYGARGVYVCTGCGYAYPPKSEPSVAELHESYADEPESYADEQTPIISAPVVESVSHFNKTNDNIKWAKWTWNPVTGCKHDCPYCYARDIANRFYPEKFEPTFHPERMSAPGNTNPLVNVPGGNNVFVCSMADLFGSWVPNDWIFQVMRQVESNPQWNFLFLTKNPRRLSSITFPDNAWVGATVDTQARVKPTEDALKDTNAKIKFVSCEPMLEPIVFNEISILDWLIIGGQSKSSQLPEFQPGWDWVISLSKQALDAGIKVYWKPNLIVCPEEYPG